MKPAIDDIVNRLRSVLHNDRSVELMNREAADEIELLREQLRLANIDIFNSSAEADTLRRERDEARRDSCGNHALVIDETDFEKSALRYAREKGWDCYRENFND